MFRLLIVLLSVFLSACAAHYTIPTDSPKATITFSTDGNGIIVQAFENERCAKNPYGTRLAYFFHGLGDPHIGVTKEIVAEREFVYTFARVVSGRVTSCAVTSAFIPRAGEIYKADFELQTGQCVARLSRSWESIGGDPILQSVPSARQISPVCYDGLSG